MTLDVTGLKAWYGAVDAVRSIDVSVEAGRIALIVGANGAGKTTTLRAIAGLHRASRGRICVDGREAVGEPTHRMVDLGVILVPEGRRVIASMSVLENLLLGGYRRHKDSNRMVGEVYDLFPILFDRRMVQAGMLSGGEQQMLAFGRALMGHPKYLLLDEPSMGLSPIMVDQVRRSLIAIRDRGTGIIMVEQNVELGLSVADSLSVFERGQVTYSGLAADPDSDRRIVRAFLGGSAGS